jgi:hypothetical protein
VLCRCRECTCRRDSPEKNDPRCKPCHAGAYRSSNRGALPRWLDAIVERNREARREIARDFELGRIRRSSRRSQYLRNRGVPRRRVIRLHPIEETSNGVGVQMVRRAPRTGLHR